MVTDQFRGYKCLNRLQHETPPQPVKTTALSFQLVESIVSMWALGVSKGLFTSESVLAGRR